MNGDLLLDLWRSALITAVMVGAPFVLVALAVGLTMSLVQAATQLQENALSFVPKIIAMGVVLSLAGPWALGRLVTYTRTTVESMVRLADSGR